MKQSERIAGFVETIWDWYSVHKRSLPWRDLKIEDETERAYHILVSEIMLQQTQVERVKIVFKKFLLRFPTLADLAQASNKEVILAWRGMGYNSRALRLRDAAKSIRDEHRGVFPKEMEQLLSIKGIGHYTTGAIRNFAFGIPTPCIDTNIRRILHRTFVGPELSDGSWSMRDDELLKLCENILLVAIDGKQNHDTANWHAALMDFGSLVQTKRNPRWDMCPLTARGLMKTKASNFQKLQATSYKLLARKEPGRIVAGKHIPNRIFRGRVVEALRDHDHGLKLEEIGKHITVDWDTREHQEWLSGILEKLKRDVLIRQKGKVFVLAE